MRLLLLAAVFSAVASLHSQEPQVIDGVAAVVNDDVITFSQVREITAAEERAYRGNIEKIKEARLRAVNALIDRQLILQEFRKMKGATIPSYAVNDRITALIRDEFGGDRPTFLKTIAQQGLTLERIRQMEEEKMIVGAMRAREVKGDPIVTKSQIESYYNQHRQEWTTNDEVKLRLIKINPSPDPAKKMKMIKEIQQKIASGADFGDLARLYSEDSTQDSGGVYAFNDGWLKRGEMEPPEMERAVFGLKVGKVSDVVEFAPRGVPGYYIFLVEARKPGITKPLKDLRDQIERHLTQVERQKMQQGWTDRLRKKAYIKIY